MHLIGEAQSASLRIIVISQIAAGAFDWLVGQTRGIKDFADGLCASGRVFRGGATSPMPIMPCNMMRSLNRRP